MFKTKLRSKIVPLVLVLIFCLTACTAKTPTVDFEQLSFDTSLFSYLGQPAEKAAAELEESGEWEYAYLDGKPGVRPTRREPVVVDGDEYTCEVVMDDMLKTSIPSGKDGRTLSRTTGATARTTCSSPAAAARASAASPPS